MSHSRRRKARALYVGPSIPDDAAVAAKNALALRREANLSGRCPSCQATFGPPREIAPGVFEARMEHEDGCPVTEVADR